MIDRTKNKILQIQSNAMDKERTKNIAAGNDLINSTFTFTCIEIAPAIKIAIPAAAGNVNSL